MTADDGSWAEFALVATGPLHRGVAVAGEIDLLTAPDLERFLRRQLGGVRPGATVVVDLARVEVLAAAGIGVLVRMAREADRRGIRLVAHPVSPRARRVLDLCGVRLEPGRRGG